MKSDNAVERLRGQADAFLEMLRPYRGLRDDVLKGVMDALRGCFANLREERLSRELVSELWGISRLGRSWALNPGGMLRRNNLIDAADQEKLWKFFEDFDYAVLARYYAVLALLGDGDPTLEDIFPVDPNG